MKNLYRGIFNFHNEIKREYVSAYSKEQAKLLMAKRIAKKQGVIPIIVLGWLKDHPDSYEIKLEIEYTEVENE